MLHHRLISKVWAQGIAREAANQIESCQKEKKQSVVVDNAASVLAFFTSTLS